MVTSVRLYEILKDKVGEEAAMALAEIAPAAANLATKDDIAELKQKFAELEVKFAQLETRLLRWTLVFFAPLWVAVLGTMLAVLLQV